MTCSGLIDILVQAQVMILWDFFRYIDYVSFYSKGLGWWHYGGVDFGGQSFWNLGVYSTPLGVSL